MNNIWEWNQFVKSCQQIQYNILQTNQPGSCYGVPIYNILINDSVAGHGEVILYLSKDCTKTVTFYQEDNNIEDKMFDVLSIGRAQRC